MAEPSPSQLINDWVTAAQNKDANKLANFYTSDAVLCSTPEGIVKGRTDIGNDYKTNFAAGWVLTKISDQSVNPGTDKDWAWAYGNWSGALSKTSLTGSWSILLVNQPTSSNQPNWLIQQHTIVTNC
jgi:ketosteroid isomerase-like protein